MTKPAKKTIQNKEWTHLPQTQRHKWNLDREGEEGTVDAQLSSTVCVFLFRFFASNFCYGNWLPGSMGGKNHLSLPSRKYLSIPITQD